MNEKIIRKYVGPIIFDRGNKIYIENLVREIKVQSEENSTLKIIEGIVYSTEYQKASTLLSDT